MRQKLPPKKEFINFITNNLFHIVIGLIIVIKTLSFNLLFDLTNSPIVSVVVIVLVAAVFVWPFLNTKRRYKQAFVMDVVASVILLADALYLRYFGSMMSIQSIFFLSSTVSVSDSIVSLFKLIDILFVIDLPLLYLAQRNLQRKCNDNPPRHNRFVYYFFTFLLLGSSLFVFAYDFDNVRLLTTKTFDNRVIAERYGVAAYHLLDIYGFTKSKLQRPSKEEKEEIIAEAKKHIKLIEKNEKTAIVKEKNVILLQVESLQTSVINQKVNGQELTPNINKFIKESDYFDNHYFQLGNGGTADSDFAVNASLYPMKDASSFVQYGNNDYTGIASILKENGYSTTAYHGFKRSFWNRNVALKSLGYDNFFAAESYEGFEEILMGVNDKDFLKETVKKMKEQKSPSLSYVITLTSHHPFDLPDREKSLNLSADLPENIANYYQAIHYTDQAVGEFLKGLREEGALDNSLLVLYGDHSATYSSSLGNLDTEAIKQALGASDSRANLKAKTELKKVPLVIHFPGQKAGSVQKEVSGHLDIMPTILNLLGLQANVPVLGQDLYGARTPYYAAVSYFDNGIIITKDKVYADGKIEGINNGSCYLIQNNEWIQTKVTDCAEIIPKRDTEIDLSAKLIKYNLFKEIK